MNNDEVKKPRSKKPKFGEDVTPTKPKNVVDEKPMCLVKNINAGFIKVSDEERGMKRAEVSEFWSKALTNLRGVECEFTKDHAMKVSFNPRDENDYILDKWNSVEVKSSSKEAIEAVTKLAQERFPDGCTISGTAEYKAKQYLSLSLATPPVPVVGYVAPPEIELQIKQTLEARGGVQSLPTPKM